MARIRYKNFVVPLSFSDFLWIFFMFSTLLFFRIFPFSLEISLSICLEITQGHCPSWSLPCAQTRWRFCHFLIFNDFYYFYSQHFFHIFQLILKKGWSHCSENAQEYCSSWPLLSLHIRWCCYDFLIFNFSHFLLIWHTCRVAKGKILLESMHSWMSWRFFKWLL